MQVRNKVNLLLNPLESDSIIIVEKMDELRLLAMKDIVADGYHITNYRKCSDLITEKTQKVLKAEWERVKSGK